MFTGLIEETGEVAGVDERPGGRRLRVRARDVLEDTRIGDSLSLNGCCLTVVERKENEFSVDVVPETLSRTTLGAWWPGTRVNLERALRADARMGGHLVQGHVDGVGLVRAVTVEGDGRRVTLEVPDDLARFVAEKGSVAVDGVSLTVARCAGTTCEVALIPHTLKVTAAGDWVSGAKVNLEVDLIARYLARLLEESGVPRRMS